MSQVGTSSFYQMYVPYGFSQIMVLAEVEDEPGAVVSIFLSHRELPSRMPGHYDARSPFTDHSSGMNDRYVSLLISDHSFPSGNWWVGIYVMSAPSGRDTVRFDLAIRTLECENYCSGHGSCITVCTLYTYVVLSCG